MSKDLEIKKPPRKLKVMFLVLPAVIRGDHYSPGPGYVAAYSLTHPEIKNKIEIEFRDDLDGLTDSVEYIVQEIKNYSPDVLTLSMYVWNSYKMRQIASSLKTHGFDGLIVAGGPWASGASEDLLNTSSGIDAVIIGEGEETFARLLNQCTNSLPIPEAIAGMPNTVVRIGEDIIAGPTISEFVDLSKVTSPYRIGILKPNRVMFFTFFRGCPLKCTFCSWAGRKLRSYPRDYLIEELKWAQRKGISEIWITDSALNWNDRMFFEIADIVHTAVPDSSFFNMIGFINVERFNTRQLNILKSIPFGSGIIMVGLQSTNSLVLKAINRSFNKRQFENGLARISETIVPTVEIMLGLPEETPATFKETVDYVANLDVKAQLYHLLGFAGTEIYRTRDKYGMEFNEKGISYLKRSKTFSEKELTKSAEYFLTHIKNIQDGSDYCPNNAMFHWFDYNLRVSDAIYQKVFGKTMFLPDKPFSLGNSSLKVSIPPRLKKNIELIFGKRAMQKKIDILGFSIDKVAIKPGGIFIMNFSKRDLSIEITLSERSDEKPYFLQTQKFNVSYRASSSNRNQVINFLKKLKDFILEKEK